MKAHELMEAYELPSQSPDQLTTEAEEDTYYQRIILNGIQAKVVNGHPIYAGTVTPEEKAKRRAKNKRARAARRGRK